MIDRARWTPAAFALIAAAAMLGWVGFRNAREDAVSQDAPYRAIRGADWPEETRQLQSLLTEAYSVLRAPQMDANLRSLQARYPSVYANDADQAASLDRIADYVAVKTAGSRYVPVDVWVFDTPGAGVDYALGTTSQGPGEGRFADIVLGQYVLNDWRSGDIVRRSCALNVAAHEYSHSISTTPVAFLNAFTDTNGPEAQIRGRRDRATPVASYLVGTVAQCTWLQMKGRVPPGGLAACVEVFGVSSGNPERCTEFQNGEPIAPRPDLAPLSAPL